MKITNFFIIGLLLSMIVVSCDVEDGKDLNGPSTISISSDLSRGELRDAVFGILSDMRVQLGTQIDGQSVAGREYWRVASSDPRWTGDLLTGTLDDNTFYTTNPYLARYATIKNANLLLEGLANTTETFTTEEVAGIRGFANTIKAHELLMVLNQQFENGIRVDVADPKNLGPFLSYEDSLTAIFNILTAAATDLSTAGDTLPFALPIGFAEINFLAFNNAVTARVEAYRGNYSSVLTFLENSFMDMDGSLSMGVYFTFSLNGADIPNPLFFALNSSLSNARLVHPTFINDAEMGDNRLGKVVQRTEPISVPGPDGISNSSDDLTATHDVFVYDSNVSPVAIIRNEELILLAAEANHISDPVAAVAAIDVIRLAAGLPNYASTGLGTSPAELVTEILRQRRYSLYAEGGHRWIDLRRFDRLNSDLANSIDRPGDGLFDRFPTPANENRN